MARYYEKRKPEEYRQIATPTVSVEEADICQRCPYDDCITSRMAGCDFYKKEMAKLKKEGSNERKRISNKN